ncbi:MAG: DNA polymerase I [Oscillospiraceae bacterium]|jgi:DNA polymerase-1|nr:DNA polymerase I [Oscillospiraceae bacterium]
MKLVILDGNSVINRAFYGIRPLTTRDGMHTNAIFGFLNILQRVQSEENPDALCVSFDLKAPTFRHILYEQYKGTRKPMPEELAMQLPVMKQVLTAMNIPIYECEGWEADDVIGTVSKLCSSRKCDCVILTGDRDSLQLVDAHVRVKLVRTQAGKTITTDYTPEVFRAEYEFEPQILVDLKALMGDSSDNIPGVPGVGPKTAAQLLKQFGTLDGIYANIESAEMKENLRSKLLTNRELAYLSYDLAMIRCDAPIDFVPENNLVQAPNRAALYDLFMRLEFQRLIDRYGLRGAQFAPIVTQEPEKRVRRCITNAQTADEMLRSFAAQKSVAVSFSQDFSAVAVAEPDGTSSFCKEDLGDFYEEFCRELLSEKIRKTAHDLKPLLRELLSRNLPTQGFVFDTALAAYLLDATRGKYALAQVAADYLHFEPEGDICSACEACAQLARVFREKLREMDCEKLYFDIELPLCTVLAHMERDGVGVDSQALSAFGQMLRSRIAQCESLIIESNGGELNINSTRQLGQLLFEKIGLPPVKKTKSGYSTDVEVLEKLRGKHPVVQAIMDYRMLTKLNSTYVEGLQKVTQADGRIRSTFQNLITATGRLSSTEPNLQNIPVRTELGSKLRKMFVPREGWVFVDADYSQIELRVLAHIADDKAMQAAFLSGKDFHSITASQVFGVALDEVTPLMRRHAKAVNFGIVYGISEFSLAADIGVSRYEAKAYMESYFEKYRGVRAYMQTIVESARAQGYVTTLFGRRRNIPELKSSNFNVRSGAERIALNTPIQGTAADIIKLAMVRVYEALEKENLQARLILQVHDELIVECPGFEANRVMEIVTREMEQVVKLRVPLIAEAKMGESWYAAK